MTQYGQAPTAPPAPPPVQLATKLLYGVIALQVVGVVASFLLRDEAMAAVEAQGELGGDLAQRMTSVGLVMGVAFALAAIAVYVVLAVFTRRGHGWARIVLTVIGSLGVLGSLLTLASLALTSAFSAPVVEPVAYTVVRALVGLALWVAIGVLLWRPASSAFFSASKAQREARASGTA